VQQILRIESWIIARAVIEPRRVGGRGCAFPVTLQKKSLNFKKINQQSGRLS